MAPREIDSFKVYLSECEQKVQSLPERKGTGLYNQENSTFPAPTEVPRAGRRRGATFQSGRPTTKGAERPAGFDYYANLLLSPIDADCLRPSIGDLTPDQCRYTITRDFFHGGSVHSHKLFYT